MKNLYDKEAYYFLPSKGRRSGITIGAPHHAIGGVKYLPCPTHRDADENTGFIAKMVADLVDCNYAIVCNMRVDANKSEDTEYYQQIGEWDTKYLIEIHGHGAVRALSNAIEVSSGKQRRKESMLFADFLQQEMKKVNELKGFAVSGDYSNIYFKAEKTASVNDSRWLTYHIELPPAIRIDDDSSLPRCGALLASEIAKTIQALCH
jgi:hypothetical protein